jgi:hypothetical protein
MGREIRCPYCGLKQDEPKGLKICAQCGGSLENEMKPSVFIAYSRIGSKFVDKLVADLKARGVKTWRDVDDIKGAAWGDQAQWRLIVDRALKSSAAMVVVLSPSSIDSNEVMAEWSYFSKQKRPMFPVIADHCEIPYFLESYQLWDLTKNYNEKIDDLGSVLSKTTGGPPVSITQPKPRPKPPVWKILVYALIPIFILAMVLFGWPGVLRNEDNPPESTMAIGVLTESPTEEESEPALVLPSDLGTPEAKPTQGNPVGSIDSNPRPTSTATTFSSTPLNFVTATPGAIGENIADNEAWVNTYPSGAKIYLVEATADLSDIEVPDVATGANFVGIAPVIFEIPPGSYYLVAEFSSDLFDAGGFTLPSAKDPTFDGAFPFDGNSINQYSYNDDDSIASYSKLYRLEKRAGDPEPLICIGIPVPEDERQLSGVTLYPSLAAVDTLPISFDYVEDSMRDSITRAIEDTGLSSMVGEDLIAEMMSVLLRVGKVKLDSDGADIIVQMSHFGKSGWSTSVYE